MNIQPIIDLLNKEKGYNLSSEYYPKVDEWRDWWRGFHKPFHQYKELSGDKTVTRELYTLKMAKKVCEDWAAILLNEKTEIVVEDDNSNKFLHDDKNNGILEKNDFWQLGNSLVEKAFYSGTGAFVLKLDGMKLQGENIVNSPEANIRIDYLTAHNIIPLTVRNGKVIEVAFASEIFKRGKKYIYLETHEIENDKYKITNRYFIYNEGQLKEESLPDGILPVINTGTDIPWFSIFGPNIVNTIPNSNGLGMSIFANAIDNLKGVDLAFNNFCRDFKLGGKKVFYSDSLIRTDVDGNKITPDDTMQQLFSVMGELPLREDGKNSLMTEYNPDLRVQANKDGIQAHLDYLSFKCGFGTKHYQFNGSTIVTATQYSGDKQELIQNAAKHYIVIEKALNQIVKAILWAGKEILGEQVNPDAKVTVNFEDSYIIDKESERLRDLQEIRDGIMQKWEYRKKWYGEDEETAKKMVAKNMSDDDYMGFGGGS